MIIIHSFPFFRRFLLLFLLILFQLPCACAEVDSFSVQRVGQMISYTENTFSVQAPTGGMLTITVSDRYHVYRVIRCRIPKGTSAVPWDGCAYNQERLYGQYYTFDFRLEGENGQTYTYSFSSPVVDNAQFLQFALPSSDKVYLSSTDDWFIEAKAIKDGSLILEFRLPDAADPAFTLKKPLHLGRVEHYTFTQLLDRFTPEPGKYSVRIYEASRPSEDRIVPLEIEDGAPEKATLSVTGDIMPPADATDAELWEAMMQPAAVVDIDYLKHQKVYSEPDSRSKSLGTLHGQTQCLSILEIQDEWIRIGAWNHEEGAYVEGWIPKKKIKIVHPNPDYGLLIDKKAQTMSVFFRGERIETLLVSTGRMDLYRYDRETSAGCYFTGLHRVDFSTQGNRYDFVIQYDGGNLLHQIPYSSGGNKDFTQGRAFLGTKASHACIRIQDEPGAQSGINAYWIWTHIPYHTKIIILDDPEERVKAKALLKGTVPVTQPVPELFTDGQTTGSGTVTITFGGDVIPGESEGSLYARKSIHTSLTQFGYAYPFSALQTVLGSDDLTCVSLECTLKENSNGELRYRPRRFRGLPEYSAVFPEGSVELVCLANEHVHDYGDQGFESTVQSLERSNTDWIAAGHPCTFSVKGCLFGFGACTEDDYLADPQTISNDIAALRNQGCTYVIYQCHWGDENDLRHGKLQEAMARACERAGADLVIGHHPAAVQGIDYLNGMPVVYSLGKLIPCSAVRMKTYGTLLVQAEFSVDDPEQPARLKLIPVLYSSSAADKTNDFRPVLASGADKTAVLKAVQSDTAFDLGTLAEE